MTHTPHDRRMRIFQNAGLYLVTAGELSCERTTTTIVTAALKGGCRLIQLREKNLPLKKLIRLGHDIRQLTRDQNALLIVNDRLDVALALEADGVHLGLDDFPVAEARRLAPDMIIGASSHSEAEAIEAQRQGASYVNIGPIFPTQTKNWSGEFLGLTGLRRIAPTVSIPFTVMGGIKQEHIPDLVKAGAQTLAVVTAITTAPDPEKAIRAFLSILSENRSVR